MNALPYSDVSRLNRDYNEKKFESESAFRRKDVASFLIDFRAYKTRSERYTGSELSFFRGQILFLGGVQ